MAAVDVINGESLLVQVEWVGSSGTYTHPCLINTERGIQFSANTTESVVPDCDDPTLPAWVSRETDGLSATINGSGMLDVASADDWFTWFNSGDAKNVKVKTDKTGGNTWTGSFRLTEFSMTGTRKEKATASITLVSDGPITQS
ncbi:phage tail tube protein [Brevundimonas sp. 2R-24]|uniref:Phage tail tube protein n=1 Tax=Peiella sedimenti TaxID=3061083 RepID=A0ABT8SPK6_9CAUL|nr:phage tail tube protein [Caulobacteraceae bacterium XZ-24]